MLYVIHGKDRVKARVKLGELLLTLQTKRPDASLFRISTDNWAAPVFNELLDSRGLFSPKYIIVLDGLVTSSQSSDIVTDAISRMADAEHVCVVIEEKILAAPLKKLEAKATKVQLFDLAEKTKKEAPEVFTYADAVAMKDSKKAWVLFQSLANEGVAAEEIHGVLWWQFKSVSLAKQARSVKESGLSPYVYQKSSRAGEKWESLELDKCIDTLVDMYHQAHRGEIDFMLELEKFSLAV